MIEQCRVSERSQLLLRLASSGAGAAAGRGGLRTMSDRRSSLISGTDAVSASRLVGITGRNDEGTVVSLYSTRYSEYGQKRGRRKGGTGRPSEDARWRAGYRRSTRRWEN